MVADDVTVIVLEDVFVKVCVVVGVWLIDVVGDVVSDVCLVAGAVVELVVCEKERVDTLQNKFCRNVLENRIIETYGN